MCGRFAQCADADTLARHFELATVPALTPHYNVAPTQPVLAVRIDDSGQRELTALRWGLVPSWSKGPDNRYSMINARAETVATKPAYRAAFARRRCLIPADAFYEWRATADGKVPHAIRREDREPFAMAGLWEHWTGTGRVRDRLLQHHRHRCERAAGADSRSHAGDSGCGRLRCLARSGQRGQGGVADPCSGPPIPRAGPPTRSRGR